MEFIVTLIFLLPGAAALVAGVGCYLVSPCLKDIFSPIITTSSVVISAILSIFTFYYIGYGGGQTVNVDFYTWLSFATFDVSFGMMVDKMTATMLMVVAVVSACVQVYSFEYMHTDKSKARFFAYLSLFTFSMLALVSAPNMLQMFLGWEGVGVCSYLLIGFWHQKETANAAAMKAFIVNRIADAAMLVGLFTIIFTFGSLDYADILPRAGEFSSHTLSFFSWNIPVLDLIGIMLFIGAMGKSAQLGLHTWLPDAMEGPTPVSALIHAATMVTAGVFLMCRMSPLLEFSEITLHIIAWVGALTALFAATIGLTQTDIKRVIAYSTCSQLGYMFFAIGVSAYPAAMFHLTTHAFFKALLFLGAGAVIHALHHEQNMFKMGGVRKTLVVTYALMWVGSLALAGIPPFAGYFSKDLIIESAFGAQGATGYSLYVIGTVAALLTAFYSFRVIFLAFHGSFKGKPKVLAHATDNHKTMRIAMYVLAVGAIFSGFILSGMGTLEWWQGALVILDHHQALENAHHTPFVVKYLPLLLAAFGIFIAWIFYIRRPCFPQILAKEASIAYSISFNKWYVDEMYDYIIVKNIKRISRFLWQTADVKIVDGMGPNGMAYVVRVFANRVRNLQTGYVYHYAFIIVLGICGLLTWVIV